MQAIDLNADLGEGSVVDSLLMGLISSANIACGGHAGDSSTMEATVSAAARNNVTIGAHPSYPDREGFGRRDIEMDAKSLTEAVISQVESLATVARGLGQRVKYLKPHGALYNRIWTDEIQAGAVVEAAKSLQLPILGPSGSSVEKIARERNVGFFREAVIDRQYQNDGTLVSRMKSGAVIRDKNLAADRAVRLTVQQQVETADGKRLSLKADSLCIHSDTEGAVSIAEAVRAKLEVAGVEVRSFL
ncbi:MAG: LamB/YcsF family protein [Cryobacterium sp.]|nr:LamB/YcsF family protein [Cryobacterium sp.]